MECTFVVIVTAKKRFVTVKGPRGTLSKSFRHIQCELTLLSKKKLRVDIWFANRKQLACLRTVCSHVENLIKGVTYVSVCCWHIVYRSGHTTQLSSSSLSPSLSPFSLTSLSLARATSTR